MIDKLDLRLPRLTQIQPAVADYIKDSRAFQYSTRRLGSKYYEFVTDLKPMGIDARLHIGLKHPGAHAGEGKLELFDTGLKSLSEITAEIESTIEGGASDLEIMRIDLCADIVGVPVEWFFDKLRVKYKRVAREIGELKTDRIGKVGIQTLYAGTRPNLLRVYDKVAEYKDQLRKEQRKAKRCGNVDGLSEFTLESLFGVSEEAVITRIESQIGGGIVPNIKSDNNKVIARIETFGKLRHLPDFNPFSNVLIENGHGGQVPTTAKGRVIEWLEQNFEISATRWVRSSSTEMQHLASALGALQKVRPVLHHPGAWLQIECVIVGRTHLVAGRVGKLQLDVFMIVTLLVKNGRSKAAESVASHAALVSHPLQRLQNCVVAHWLFRVTASRKKPFAVSREAMQDCQRL
jgi:hypothetical protein